MSKLFFMAQLRKNFRLSALICAGVLFVLTGPASFGAFDDDYFLEEEEIHLVRGDLETIRATNLKRVSVSDPAVADIANIESDYILLLAKSSGHTNFFMWDESGKRSYVIRVFDDNLELVKGRLTQLLKRANISGVSLNINDQEGKVILTGDLDESKMDRYKQVISPFSASILDLVKEKEDEDLIQIDAIVAELTSSFTKSLGVQWSGLSALSYTESDFGNKKIDKFGDIFKLGDFKRTDGLIASINAAITEGKGRVLSKPKLVVVSGEEASFLVGGQVPIVTTTTSAGGTFSENVEFKNFGVDLKIKPTLRNPTLKELSLIEVDLNLDISDLDAANSVGNKTAFSTRSAQTVLLLENGQTVVLAGLLKQNEGETVERVPFFSDIPVLGALFRTKSHNPDTETELVVSLTPTVIPQQNLANLPPDMTVESEVTVPAPRFRSLPAIPSPQAGLSRPPDTMESYVRFLQENIARHIAYPLKAKQYGWEGTVKLNLLVLRDGTLAHASIQESSGYNMFDENALETAKRLSPYAGFPSGVKLDDITVTIPIVYSLE